MLILSFWYFRIFAYWNLWSHNWWFFRYIIFTEKDFYSMTETSVTWLTLPKVIDLSTHPITSASNLGSSNLRTVFPSNATIYNECLCKGFYVSGIWRMFFFIFEPLLLGIWILFSKGFLKQAVQVNYYTKC